MMLTILQKKKQKMRKLLLKYVVAKSYGDEDEIAEIYEESANLNKEIAKLLNKERGD